MHHLAYHRGRKEGAQGIKRQPIKILVVDERPLIRAGMKAMLRAPDIRIVGEAGKAYQTLRLIGVRAPHVVLIGDRVQEPDGLDLLRRIKEKWPKTAVIIVTTIQGSAYLSRALALGCSGYVRDGMARGELLKVVHAASRGESVVEPQLLRKLLEDVSRQHPIDVEADTTRQLSLSERQVLRLISEGRTNRDIAHQLGYSIGAVKDYIQKIIKRLHVSDRTQAAVKAVRLGLVD